MSTDTAVSASALADERYHSVPDLAERWGVHHMTIRRWIWDGRLRATKIGRSVRVPDSAIAEFLAEGMVA